MHLFSRNLFLSGVAAAALFAATVGIGISLVTGGEPAEDPKKSSSAPVSVIESEPVSSSEDEGEESASVPEESSESAPASSSSAPAASSSSAPAQSSSAPAQSSSSAPASSAPAPVSNITGVFDPAVMTGSGKSNISSYRQINTDVKAWLKVPGTNINYPVLYHDSDVNYYLERDLYKQYSRNGVIWADPGARFGEADDLSDNTVLYGHNWTNVSANPRIGSASDVMFAQLTSYHHLNFAKQYPYVYYSTEDESMTWVIFAAFYTDISFIYNDCNPGSDGLDDIIDGAKARSRHIFDVDVDSSDKILTLSTCTRAYGSSDRQRFVVMARQLRPGEDIEAISVKSNPNPILPKL